VNTVTIEYNKLSKYITASQLNVTTCGEYLYLRVSSYDKSKIIIIIKIMILLRPPITYSHLYALQDALCSIIINSAHTF